MQNDIIIGIDEAGRGALVGPVYAACCYIDDNFDKSILNDSKRLSEKRREEVRKIIVSSSIYGIGFATHTEIDKLNILKATFLAMQRAFDNFLEKAKLNNLDLNNSKIIVDGSILPPFLEKYNDNNLFKDKTDNFHASYLVKADSKVPSVMAASILAKTARDEFMLFADKKWPCYSYRQHKGYGTSHHRKMIEKFGPSPIARQTFKFK